MSSNVNLDKDSTTHIRSSGPGRAPWRIEDIAAEVTALARERPGQTLAAAAILGALVGGLICGLSRRGEVHDGH